VIGDARSELFNKCGLADPWLATDQEKRAVASLHVVQAAPEVGEFPLPAHEGTGQLDHLRSAGWWRRPGEGWVLVEYAACK
jgi:hypothetical protein